MAYNSCFFVFNAKGNSRKLLIKKFLLNANMVPKDIPTM